MTNESNYGLGQLFTQNMSVLHTSGKSALFNTPLHLLPKHFASPIILRSLMNRFLGSHFVSISVIISCVGQYFTSTVPSITTSRMKWYLTEMCFEHP